MVLVSLTILVIQANASQGTWQSRASHSCNATYNRAIHSFNAGALESALTSFKQATDCFKRAGAIAQAAQALKLVGQTSRRLGRTSDALNAFRQALQYHLSGQVTDQATEAELHWLLGWTYHDSGSADLAVRSFNLAVASYRAHGNLEGEANSLAGLGKVHLAAERYADAAQALKSALTIYDKLRNSDKATESRYNLATCEYQLNHFAQAILHLESVVQQSSDPRTLAYAYFRLGNAHFALEQWQPSLVAFQQGSRRLTEIGDAGSGAICEYNIAQCFLKLENWERAAEHLHAVVSTYRSGGDSRSLLPALTALGHANFNSGKFSEAARHYREAVAISEESGLYPQKAEALGNLGDALTADEQSEQAAVHFGSCAQLYQQLGNPVDALESYRKQGDAYAELGHQPLALEAYRRALELATGTTSLRQQIFDIRLKLADTRRESADFEGALLEYERVLSGNPRLAFSKSQLGQALFGKGRCNLALERNAEAAPLFEAAGKAYMEAGKKQSAANALYNGGLAHKKSSNHSVAIERFTQALVLYGELNDRKSEADCHKEIGATIKSGESRLRSALDRYLTALRIYESLNDSEGMAACYKDLGGLYLNVAPADPRKAENAYVHARALLSSAGKAQGVAECDFGVARVRFGNKEYAAAIDLYLRAESVFSTGGDVENAALCLTNAGHATFNLEHYEQALALYNEASARYETTGSKQELAECRRHAADCLVKLYRHEDAWLKYEQCLGIFQDNHDQVNAFKVLLGLGDVYFGQGLYSEAHSKFQEALRDGGTFVQGEQKIAAYDRLSKSSSALGDFDTSSDYLNKAGELYQQSGDRVGQLRIALRQADSFYQRDLYEQAIAFYDRAGADSASLDPEIIKLGLTALVNKANVYHEINSDSEATKFYQAALRQARAVRDSSHIMASLTGLANILTVAGDVDVAQTHHSEVLAIASLQKDSLMIASAYINLGNIAHRKRDVNQARLFYEQANAISSRFKESESVAIALNNLGILELERGLNLPALSHFQMAQKEAEGIYLKRLLIAVFSNQGVAYEQMGQYESALTAYDRAISEVEHIREGFKNGDLFQSYIKSTTDLYDRVISLLFDRLGDANRAYEYIDRSLSTGLVELYEGKARTTGNLKLANKLAELKIVLEKERLLQGQIQQNQKNTAVVNRLSVVLARTSQEVTDLERWLFENYPDYPGVLRISAANIASIQDKIPDDAVVVTFYPAPNKLYIYVATQDDYKATSVDISRADLYAKIREYRALVKKQRDDAVQNFVESGRGRAEVDDFLRVDSWSEDRLRPLVKISTELHRYLIKPVANLFGAAKTLLIIPSGMLYYLPLHALTEQSDGHLEFVIQKWTVAYLTSTTFARSISGGSNVSADVCRQRVSYLGYSAGNLSGVQREVDSLRVFAPQARIFTERDASESRAKTESLQSCVFILSGHCNVNPEQTGKTYLQLASADGEDGRWYTREIEQARQSGGNFARMDLAILPNCATAVGEDTPVFGVRNLVQSFSQAGASSVMATLWPVSDMFTPNLMSAFFRNFFQAKHDKAMALRDAQLAMLRNPQTAHPFFWAGFLLYGYWSTPPAATDAAR